MGRSINYRGLTLVIPDAYSSLDVSRLLTPTAGGLGIVALVGESDGGQPGITLFPGGSSPAIVQTELKSGPLANCARLALRSGIDPAIQAGASLVIAYKTNGGTQATASVGGLGPAIAEQLTVTCPADVGGSLDLAYFVLPVNATTTVGFYIDLDNAGQPAPAGLIALTPTTTVPITSVTTNDVATIVASLVQAAILSTGFFTTSISGAVVTTYLIFQGAVTGESSGSGQIVVAVVTPGQDADTDAQVSFTSKQYGSFTNLYSVSIASSMGAKFITVRDENGVPEVSPAFGATVYATLLYTGNGTAATMTLSYVAGVLRLQTTLTGQSDGSVNLNIDVTNLTLTQLKNQLDTLVGYTLTIPQQFLQRTVSFLDLVLTPITIKTTPFSFVASLGEAVNWGADQSFLASVTRGLENEGDTLPSSAPLMMFAGGTRGSSSNASVQAALNELLEYRINILVPLFSSDSQDGSTITISAVNAQVKDHLVSRSSILGRSECQGYISVLGNKAAFLAQCSQNSTRWLGCLGQSIVDLSIAGEVIEYPPYGLATVIAQTQAGSPVGTDLTYKALPILGFSQTGWIPSVNGPELILGGALIINRDENNVIRCVAGYTTWLADGNNANIYIETVESLSVFAYQHRQFMKSVFLGRSSFSSQDVLTAIKTSLLFERDTTRSIKGFDVALIKIIQASAGRLEYEVAVVPFEGIKFVLPTIIAIRDAAA